MITPYARAVTRLVLLLSVSAASLCSLPARAYADGPHNLPVTDVLRTELIEAGAALKGIPAASFTGLAQGATYYAFDPGTGIHWAGAHLVPRADSYQAQVSDQDAGSYLLFEQPQGGVWTAFNDGVARNPGCPAPLPPEIIALWGWDPQQCRPALDS